jgi:hypothetical protein
MVDLADLAAWTPVALHLNPPSIDWCDLRGARFAEPFLDQTVERLVAEGRALARTDLDALLALDSAPSLEPDGIVLHLSRCGSTLVSRLLATVPGVLVVAEPAPLNTLLQADPARIDRAARIRVLRLLARALGRIRFGDERRYVLKLSSWNVRRADLLLQAFPAAKFAWVQREPAEVMASLLAEPPGWLALHARPRVAEHLFGIPPDETAALDRVAFAARALGAMLAAAADLPGPVVDYRDLPAAVWTRVAPSFGIGLDEEAVARMQQESRFDAKRPVAVAYEHRIRHDITPEIVAAAVSPAAVYAALGHARVACSSSS